ncbi:MAG TPA: RNA methyltransferase [Solirubrobacterales bacterium]|nr:RNA methyltransferase [Solirubrobacterales bacterium]
MITSPDNEKLKRIRKLRSRRERDRTGLFVVEGEDLVAAAEAAGAGPELLLVAGEDVEPRLLAAASTLGSGARVIGVYRQRWSLIPSREATPRVEDEEAANLCVYLHGVADPGNIGAILRAAHALCDGPVVLGPGCADPYSPKAVRASMGSVFARPPARAELAALAGTKLALDGGAPTPLVDLELRPPVVICLGGEREGLPTELASAADARARIPMRPDGPDSLNVAMAAAVALYELGHRMAAHA